jgi:hypothetical protein
MVALTSSGCMGMLALPLGGQRTIITYFYTMYHCQMQRMNHMSVTAQQLVVKEAANASA